MKKFMLTNNYNGYQYFYAGHVENILKSKDKLWSVESNEASKLTKSQADTTSFEILKKMKDHSKLRVEEALEVG